MYIEKACRARRLGFGAVLITSMVFVDSAQGARYYVDCDATGSNDGSSWTDAWTTFQHALQSGSPSSGDEIWVAEGTYYPDEGPGQTNNARGSTFLLDKHLFFYGGFDGTESDKATATPSTT